MASSRRRRRRTATANKNGWCCSCCCEEEGFSYSCCCCPRDDDAGVRSTTSGGRTTTIVVASSARAMSRLLLVVALSLISTTTGRRFCSAVTAFRPPAAFVATAPGAGVHVRGRGNVVVTNPRTSHQPSPPSSLIAPSGRSSAASSGSSLYFMGSDGGILGIGGPELVSYCCCVVVHDVPRLLSCTLFRRRVYPSRR